MHGTYTCFFVLCTVHCTVQLVGGVEGTIFFVDRTVESYSAKCCTPEKGPMDNCVHCALYGATRECGGYSTVHKIKVKVERS